MIQKKVCMLGASAVGKTSLVARFVKSVFDEKYHTSIGVKVDKKTVTVGQEEVGLLLWDLYGEDEFQKLQDSYLRGSGGYVLAVDGTRRETLDRAVVLGAAPRRSPESPFVLVINKSDLADKWEVDDAALADLAKRRWPCFKTSAKSGAGVEEMFWRAAMLK
jgi:small GTP-binding protein